MQPLYTLDIGKPGSSFALEIAERTGLPYKTLEAARQLAGKELVSFETLIRNLESEKNLLTEKLSNLLLKEAELTNLLTVYHRLKEDLESRKKQIVNRAKEEARNLLEEANREIEKTIRHIRENQAQKTETIKARKGLNQLNRKLSGQDFRNPPVTSAPIETGDSVRIVGQNGSGIVLSVKGKSAMVQFGEIKSKVDLAKLEKTTLPTSTVESRGHALSLGLNEKRSVYSNVLDIRGKRAEEVAPILDKFLDESVLVGQGEVKILHGKGEGVLRKIVREQLRKYSQVASVADEHVERGGDGITVVILK
jgi:DNA mismatch repair protein MutS2